MAEKRSGTRGGARRTTQRRNAKKKQQNWLERNSLGIIIASMSAIAVVAAVLLFAFIPYSGNEEQWIYIPENATRAQVKDSLKTHLGSGMGMRVYTMWRAEGGNPQKSNGAYKVTEGETALKIAHRISTGRQTPVKVSFRGARTMKQVASRIASQLQFDQDSFLEACADVLPEKGFEEEEFIAAFIPDTYEFYWSASPVNVVNRLLDYRNEFWTPERVRKASEMGLSKVEVATIASIVEEETAKSDERPKVARLYLNRLKKGMKLQADPTVKFAVGDFSLRRILGSHLKVDSPYNTYKVNGLPPGPIRMPDAKTLDAVLNAPQHPFIYMCAKEDFSGYHNFATDYDTHLANARRYQAALNARGIKK
ncbi:MAG: endolytic transglycosylase MltG [Duncaniella sp.]|nr:endolytic transglycosylase MltG [Duncaniella sp.]